MRCPYCGAFFLAASASTGPEPDYEPGVLCPECGEFISDEELEEMDEREDAGDASECAPRSPAGEGE